MKLSAAVWKALVLGVLVGGVAAVTPACGPARRPVTCNASNCPGCCDENAQCFTGLADIACGNAGTTCMACAMGQTCVASSTGSDAGTGGRCLSGSTGGGAGGGSATGGGAAGGSTAGGSAGGGTGGGAAMCNAQNCPNGCCTSSGLCQNPGTTARCGTGGAACMACPSRQTCVAGACTACPGCVDLATGRCEMGTTSSLCGKSGDFCANCTVSNGMCSNQICTGNMSGCNATNCANGCCDQGSGMCVQASAQSGQQCGQGVPGSLCTSCPSNMCDTDGGVCIGGGMGGGAGGGLPGLDGGLPGFGTPCDPATPCPTGECCLTLLGSSSCATINMAPPIVPFGKVCGLSGMACGATCLLPAPFGTGNMCNVSTGTCQ